MEHTHVQKLAHLLKILVTVTFVCNLLALPLVPGLVGISAEGGIAAALDAAGSSPSPLQVILTFLAVCWQYLWRIWRAQYTAVLTVFLLFCGGCTAVILWQARRVLDTIVHTAPFCRENAANMRRASVCCFLIAAAALLRTCWGLWYYRTILPLLTYNALFVPLFLMGGLLCMVMSTLFRQAAQLKEENDLTI